MPVGGNVLDVQPGSFLVGQGDLADFSLQPKADVQIFDRDGLIVGRGKRADDAGHKGAARRHLQGTKGEDGNSNRNRDQESEDSQGKFQKTHLR